MTTDQAKECLSFHSGRHSNYDDPRWQNGFLGSLRPYQGNLVEDNFHEVMNCLKVLAKELGKTDFIAKDVVSDIQGIIHYSRAWALYEEGMLRSNNLISDTDQKTIEIWIEILSHTFTLVVELGDDEEVWFDYNEYLSEFPLHNK